LRFILNKIAPLFSRYPNSKLARPWLFDYFEARQTKSFKNQVVCIQSVPNIFYFILFGTIAKMVKSQSNLRLEFISIHSINGSIGTGFIAKIKRSFFLILIQSSQWIRGYGRIVDSVGFRNSSLFHPFYDVKAWIKAGRLWDSLKSPQAGHFTLLIDGIDYSDLVIDTYLRFKPSPLFDVSSHFVRYLIWQLLREIRLSEQYFRSVRPLVYLTSYSSYIMHGVPVRIALKYGVSVWSFGDLSHFGKKLSMDDSYHGANCSEYFNDFLKLDNQNNRLLEAKNKFEIRLSGEKEQSMSYMRQSAYGSPRKRLPDLSGTVIIFLHDFYDSPHIHEELLFLDFWSWACFTIEILKEIGVNFYLKPHPNQVQMNDEVIMNLNQKYPNLKWLPDSVNNLDLINGGISCGITVYGSISVELAYFGIPSITCSKHSYHAFDFCRTAKNLDEYKQMLQSANYVPIAKKEMQRQALIFFYMHFLNKKEEERHLMDSYLKIWTACNFGGEDNDIISEMKRMSRQKGFVNFVKKNIFMLMNESVT
jgi:hypothetical protein